VSPWQYVLPGLLCGNINLPLCLEDPVTPRNPRSALEDQARKSDTHADSVDASLTLRDILLKVGEAGAGGANGTFDFDLLGMSSAAFCRLSFRSPTFLFWSLYFHSIRENKPRVRAVSNTCSC
jgi:hypothetical protein